MQETHTQRFRTEIERVKMASVNDSLSLNVGDEIRLIETDMNTQKEVICLILFRILGL